MATIIRKFKNTETESYSMFILLCEILQESIKLRHEIEDLRNRTSKFLTFLLSLRRITAMKAEDEFDTNYQQSV